MKLLVTTPLSVALEAEGVLSLTAEDASGLFGILPGHEEFLTVLTVCVLTWRDSAGQEHHVALRGGVLTVRDGESVEVATQEAVGEETLRRLGDAVLRRLRQEAEIEESARTSATRLQMAAIRQLQSYLQAGRPGGRPGGRQSASGAAGFEDGGGESPP